MFNGLAEFGDQVGKGAFGNFLAGSVGGLANHYGPAMMNAAAQGSAIKAGLNAGAASSIGQSMMSGLGLGELINYVWEKKLDRAYLLSTSVFIY